MRLNLVLVLSTLFAYSECMNLSNFSQNAIRNIMNTYGQVTDSESFMSNVYELSQIWGHVDEHGSLELVTILINAHQARELTDTELNCFFKEAVRAGNFIAYKNFSSYWNYDRMEIHNIAALNGHVNILEQEFSATSGYGYDGERAKILPDVIRAGHINVLRRFAVTGQLFCLEARVALIAALDAETEEIINYLLHERIYLEPFSSDWFKYQECMKAGQFVGHEKILVKAAEVGNITVVEYFLSRNFLTKSANLEEAQKAAAKNGHTEIANLIGTWRMF